MKSKVGYLGLIFLLIFSILFIIVNIIIYQLEPNDWYNSWYVSLLLVLSLIFGCSGFILIFYPQTKEYFIQIKKAKCKHCGNRNRTSALYCDKCGEKL